MIKRFMKRVRSEGILKEHCESLSFEKPSQRRRKKRARALFGRLGSDRA
jgi:ribosomal protein S21